jgi:hypothetical protein
MTACRQQKFINIIGRKILFCYTNGSLGTLYKYKYCVGQSKNVVVPFFWTTSQLSFTLLRLVTCNSTLHEFVELRYEALFVELHCNIYLYNLFTIHRPFHITLQRLTCSDKAFPTHGFYAGPD